MNSAEISPNISGNQASSQHHQSSDEMVSTFNKWVWFWLEIHRSYTLIQEYKATIENNYNTNKKAVL